MGFLCPRLSGIYFGHDMNRSAENDTVPVVLFTHRRKEFLKRTLACLRCNQIPLLIVYCDGPRHEGELEAVEETRQVVRSIDWCETRIVERPRNFGLGASIRDGVTETLSHFDSAVVFEDDIDCVLGTYQYMCAALRQYALDKRVMSVSAYSHPSLRPTLPSAEPHFAGRFSCWGWGTWRRAWVGMEIPARTLLWRCRLMLKDVNRYGGDIPWMAGLEMKKNIWAVRFCLLHILRGGLALYPPTSLSNHFGFCDSTTSSGVPDRWLLDKLEPCPPIPLVWPVPIEHPACPGLFQSACGAPAPLTATVRDAVLRFRWAASARVHAAADRCRERIRRG